jgi:hypothetical protein
MQYTGGKGFFDQQPTPTALAATATLTIAQLLAGIVTTSGTVAITLTLPTGTLSDAGVTGPALPVNGSFDWAVINIGTVSAAVTIAAGTGHTLVGSAAIAIGSSARFRTRKTAAATFVTYRMR